MAEQRTHMLEILKGAAGLSVYLDNHRIAGSKPWGGAPVEHSWQIDRDELLMALGMALGEPVSK